jgi:hypothetical protein
MLADAMARAERIEREELIDVAEWAVSREGVPSLPFPAAVTRALWDLTVAVPFRLVHSVTGDDRVRDVLKAALQALQRSTEPLLCLDPQQGFTTSFGVFLPGRCGPRWRPLRLVCGPDEVGQIVLTIGLVDEFKAIPLATPYSSFEECRHGLVRGDASFREWRP